MTIICPFCNTEFGTNRRRKYCSRSCRERYHYKNQVKYVSLPDRLINLMSNGQWYDLDSILDNLACKQTTFKHAKSLATFAGRDFKYAIEDGITYWKLCPDNSTSDCEKWHCQIPKSSMSRCNGQGCYHAHHCEAVATIDLGSGNYQANRAQNDMDLGFHIIHY